MSDTATCRHCSGRITWRNPAWEHSTGGWPAPDPRIPAHDAWPYLQTCQQWGPLRRARDGKLPPALGPVLLGVWARIGAP